MKYSLMSLMVDSELHHKKINFIHRVILQSIGYTGNPESVEDVYRILQEHGIPMQNGTMTFEDMVEFACNRGFDGIDLMSFHMEMPGAEMKEILDRYQMPLSAVNMIAPFSEVKTEQEYEDLRAECWRVMEEVSAAGCTNILLMPTGYVAGENTTREQCFHKMIRGLRDCVEYGNGLGLTVNTETLESIAVPFCSIGEMKRIFAAVPELKYTHDSGNPLVANEDPIETLQTFSERVVSVHFKDLGYTKEEGNTYSCPDGRKLKLVPMGSGEIDFARHLKLLKEAQYPGYITLEGRVESEDALEGAVATLEYIRSLE